MFSLCDEDLYTFGCDTGYMIVLGLLKTKPYRKDSKLLQMYGGGINWEIGIDIYTLIRI